MPEDSVYPYRGSLVEAIDHACIDWVSKLLRETAEGLGFALSISNVKNPDELLSFLGYGNLSDTLVCTDVDGTIMRYATSRSDRGQLQSVIEEFKSTVVNSGGHIFFISNRNPAFINYPVLGNDLLFEAFRSAGVPRADIAFAQGEFAEARAGFFPGLDRQNPLISNTGSLSHLPSVRRFKQFGMLVGKVMQEPEKTRLIIAFDITQVRLDATFLSIVNTIGGMERFFLRNLWFYSHSYFEWEEKDIQIVLVG